MSKHKNKKEQVSDLIQTIKDHDKMVIGFLDWVISIDSETFDKDSKELIKLLLLTLKNDVNNDEHWTNLIKFIKTNDTVAIINNLLLMEQTQHSKKFITDFKNNAIYFLKKCLENGVYKNYTKINGEWFNRDNQKDNHTDILDGGHYNLSLTEEEYLNKI